MKRCVTFMVLALCLCLMLAGCGADKAKDSATTETTIPAGPQPNPDLKVEDCYTHTENKDGTYSYEVEWRGGGILHAEQNIDRPVSFMVAGEDVLVIHGQAGTGVGARWAKFCDIRRGRVSDTYGSYLAAVDTRVAFIDNRTDAYHVFVCDAFEPNVYYTVCTLEGLSVEDSADVVKDFALSEDGVLSVTYATADGDKTVTIDMKEE